MGRKPIPDEDRAHGKQIGQIIKRLRGEQGLSCRGLANTSLVSPDEVERLERGQIPTPGFLVVAKIADALGLGLDSLHREARGRAGRQTS